MQAELPNFSAERRGFLFPNHFASAPALVIPIPAYGDVPIGNVANGLCGGMAFAARDFFEARIDAPPGEDPPLPETPLFNYLVDRLIDSLDLPNGPLRYFQWMSLPDEDTWLGRGLRSMSLREEWPQIKKDIDQGHPVPLGLIRAHSHDPRDLGANHQVLCHGYETDVTDRLDRLVVYDPNHPRERVVLTVDRGVGGERLLYSTGEPTRGFFRSRYTRSDPRFLLNAGAVPPRLSLTAITARLRRLLHR